MQVVSLNPIFCRGGGGGGGGGGWGGGGRGKKYIINLLFAESAQSVVKVNHCIYS